jgi:FAD/FMN-containing dehydrogenase
MTHTLPVPPAAAETPLRPPAQRAPFDGLRPHLTGTLAVAGTDAYDALVAGWNLAVPQRPAAVVGARTAQDVVETVRFAARHRLTVTPQATGHGAVPGLGGEVLVATAGLDECVVHPEGWARVGAGVKWGAVVTAAAPYGLAPLNGSTTDVGVVGYTTGGGVGPMARTYGLAADRVRAIEVVTGDGRLRRATPTHQPELFFGLRGGKGALGIVTAIEFDLVRQPRFYGGALYFDGADAAVVLERWRTWAMALPEQGTTSFALLRLPPLPGVPPVLAGRLSVAVRFLWTGDAQDGAALVQELRDAAHLLVDGVAELPYAAVDAVHADPVDPMPVHEEAALLADLPAEALARLLEVAGPASSCRQVVVEVRQLGGALARPGAVPCAFDQRGAGFSLLAAGVPMQPGTVEDARAVVAALGPWATGGMFPNFAPTVDGAERCYSPATLARLRTAVRAYDPDGVLSLGRALLRPAS